MPTTFRMFEIETDQPEAMAVMHQVVLASFQPANALSIAPAAAVRAAPIAVATEAPAEALRLTHRRGAKQGKGRRQAVAKRKPVPLVRTPNNRSRVIEYFKHNELGSPKEIGHALDINPSYVVQIVNRMMAEGRLMRVARGQYKRDPNFSEE